MKNILIKKLSSIFCRPSIITLFFAFCISLPSYSFSTKAVGLFMGDPSSITFKGWKSNIEAYDTGLSFSSSFNFHLFGDYHYHFHNVIDDDEQFFKELVFYVGGGGFLSSTKATPNKESKTIIGARVPGGAEWRPKFPMSVYIEIALGLSILPETSSYSSGGVGVRYIF